MLDLQSAKKVIENTPLVSIDICTGVMVKHFCARASKSPRRMFSFRTAKKYMKNEV